MKNTLNTYRCLLIAILLFMVQLMLFKDNVFIFALGMLCSVVIICTLTIVKAIELWLSNLPSIIMNTPLPEIKTTQKYDNETAHD